MTERVHVTRSRSNPGGGSATDADVVPFRSRKPPWLKVKAPGGPTYRHIERLKSDPRRAFGYSLGTVSTLWLNTSGRASITRASGIS